jgi:hypothetical protein
MGGNALKSYDTRRLDAKEYWDITASFESHWGALFKFTPSLIKAYKAKPSFGDADYLIDSSKLPSNWTAMVKDDFRLSDEQYFKNSNVVSIGWEHFQFDLIVTPPEELEIAHYYFDYNDCGNIIGRICHKLGIKYAHDGIWLILRGKNGNVLKEILLSRDFYEILDILGLDPQPYESGFETLEDMFKWVAISKYFDPEIYALEHRSNTSRTRDRKRATYRAFLQWVDATRPEVKYNFEDKSEKGGYNIRYPFYDTEVQRIWPWVDEIVLNTIILNKIDMQYKEVYNGNIVSDITGLEGKELGQFMAQVSRQLNKDSKHHWINNPDLVIDTVKEEYAIFKS